MNVVEEIVEIRERLARMEGTIEHISKTLDQSNKQLKQIPKEGGGNIVIPVAVVLTVLEVGRVALEKLF